MFKQSLMSQWGEHLGKRQGWVCHYCLRKIAKFPMNRKEHAKLISDGYRQASIDHVIPKSKGGSDDIQNLVLACRQCNQKKKDLAHGQYIIKLRFEEKLKAQQESIEA